MEVNYSDVNFSELKWSDLFVEKCVLSLIYSNIALCRFPVVPFYLLLYLQLCSCMYILYSTLWYYYFYSLCYFVINRLECFNISFIIVVIFLFSFYFVSCFLFCVLCLLFCIALSFLFLYKFTKRCLRVETQLQ